MNTPALETPRLRLRPICEGDAKDIFACWMHDEEVSRYMEWSASGDIADAREFVRFELGKNCGFALVSLAHRFEGHGRKSRNVPCLL